MHRGVCDNHREQREAAGARVKTGISEESSPESFKTVSSNCASLEKSKAVKYVTSPGIKSMRSNPAPGSVAQLFPLLLSAQEGHARDAPASFSSFSATQKALPSVLGWSMFFKMCLQCVLTTTLVLAPLQGALPACRGQLNFSQLSKGWFTLMKAERWRWQAAPHPLKSYKCHLFSIWNTKQLSF